MIVFASLLLLQSSPAAAPETAPAPVPRVPNVLIVVADDLGTDQLLAYGEGAEVPSTPAIDKLAQKGVLFRGAYASTYCSPTRASLLTGRHPFRTGIGSYLVPGDDTAFALQTGEVTLPEMLDLGTGGRYRHGAFGKWHLGNATVGGDSAPNVAGWSTFAGSEGNLFGTMDYFSWEKLIDGAALWTTTYATTDTVDSALAWIHAAPDPWVAYVAFNAIHTPLHAPPDHLHSVDLSTADPHLNPRPLFVAMAEALDGELARLLKGLGDDLDRTNIVFLGDNGSPKDMVVPPIPAKQHKGTPWEGGIRVPLLITGPAVHEPGEVDALVQITDLFATVAELTGADLEAALPTGHKLDSVSLVPYLRNTAAAPLRATAFSQYFEPNGFGPPDDGFKTIRDERYKLIVGQGNSALLFDLLLDPYEEVNLLDGPPTPAELAALAALQAAMDALLADS